MTSGIPPTQPQAKLALQDWMVAEETVKVMNALCADGTEARFVGGCVRNALINRKVNDIDIATPLKPDIVIERLQAHGINHAPTGLKHGTVTAIVDGKTFEITTLRKDVMTFGRHAEVAFTDDWITDASRRDFTINAIFADRNGVILDPFGGVADLRVGRVVFVGNPDKRIQEDVLRILRFFRFHAHFGRGPLDPAGLAACTKHSASIAKLSGERLRQETLKILEAPNCADIWEAMTEARVLTYYLPEATNITALRRLTFLEESFESGAFPLLHLTALLDITPAGLANIVKSLKLSQAQGRYMAAMFLEDRDLSHDMSHAAARRLVYRYGNDLARGMLLLMAAKSDEPVDDLQNLYHLVTSFQPPAFPISGKDLQAAGWKEGPDMGSALKVIESWWLSNDFAPNREACLKKIQEYPIKPAGKPST